MKLFLRKQQKAPLKEAGYEHTFKFDPKPNRKNRKRQRTRNVLWFNPPYSIGVSTRIGARFLTILDKCFKEDNPLSRILNRHTIKVSYRTTPNMKQIITGHNTHLLAKHKQQGQETEPKTCSCPKSRTEPCPLGGKCLSSCIIYQATVTETESKKSETYIGMTADPLTKLYGNHKKSFKHEKYKTETDLSNHTWKLKSEKKSFKINWKIIDRGHSTSGPRSANFAQ